ncbi:hypothetical protein BEL04_21070 [Mucilaginibacter sp. PPCGB 2223]|uniref:SRPBCC family protein n=1 Tax=Mucilaginibacter sp. PPCGB 2223 TaxID=1886027 RepID=UPI000825612B|nr:SRPBCC domain-containing protein [Mucilaginibacter sp. PPCGB 2223]OCX51199.1 hypothetical protein BEL04_21070 [Mucilaginibacter sp. PPCGB 2223]
MAKIIQHQIFYPNPVTDVWEYLTVSELIAQWLMPTDFKPVVGHEFQFKPGCMDGCDFDGTFYCKVLEVTPYKTLSYSWNFKSLSGKLNTSVVNWTLTEKDNGTELLLVHRGFEGEQMLPIFNLMNPGWAHHMTKLSEALNPETSLTANA